MIFYFTCLLARYINQNEYMTPSLRDTPGAILRVIKAYDAKSHWHKLFNKISLIIYYVTNVIYKKKLK